MLHSGTALRTSFDHLGEAYIELAASLSNEELQRHGLGEWNVRELIAHALRAFSTASLYLDASPSIDFTMHTSADYYHRVLTGNPALHAEIAERGRVAAAALHDDLVGVVRSTVEAACVRVGLAPDDAIVSTPFGQIALLPYLATRILEAGVHLLDLQRALGRDDDLDPTVAEIVALTLITAGDVPHLIRGLSGRDDLPAGFNVLR